MLSRHGKPIALIDQKIILMEPPNDPHPPPSPQRNRPWMFPEKHAVADTSSI